jgi:Type II secretion system (T2SS), protein M
VNLTDRDKKIAMLLVPVIVVAAYWFLLLSPKREEASTAQTTLTEQQDRLEAARGAADAAEQAESDFEVTYATVVRLGKAIPSSVDMPSLLVQLDAAAAGTGIQFDTIAAGARTPAATEEEAPPASAAPAEGAEGESTPAAEPGGAPAQTAPGGAAEAAGEASQTSDQRNAAAEQSGVDTTTSTSAREGGLPIGGGAATGTDAAAAAAPAGLETVPLSLEFEGDFFKLADFFHRLKRFVQVSNEDVLVSGRLLTVEGVRWASDAEIFPRIRAEVTATVYLSPLTEGVTAGATPTGPAPATPAATETTPAETAPAAAPAPTATATP